DELHRLGVEAEGVDAELVEVVARQVVDALDQLRVDLRLERVLDLFEPSAACHGVRLSRDPAVTIDRHFAELWDGYRAIAPQAARIHALLEARGERLVNDHVALRTFD